MKAPLTAEVIEIAPEAEGQVRLTVGPPSEFQAAHERPGQYCWLGPPGGKATPFALLTTPQEDPPAFLIKTTSEVGASLARLEPGDHVQLSLPTGAGFDVEGLTHHRVLCVCTGTGIAPIRTVIESILARSGEFGPLSLYYGVRDPSYVALGSDLERWQRAKVAVSIHYSRNDEGETGPGYVHELLRAEETKLSDAGIIVAGQPELVTALKSLCQQMGGTPDRVLTNF